MRSIRTRVTMLVVLVLLVTLGALGLVFMRVTTAEVRRLLVTIEDPSTPAPLIEIEHAYRAGGMDAVVEAVDTLRTSGVRVLVVAGDRIVATGKPELEGASVTHGGKGGIAIEKEGMVFKLHRPSAELVDESGAVVARIYRLPDGDRETGDHVRALVRPLHRWIAILITVAAVVSVLLAIALLRGVTRPLEELTKAIRRMERGDLTVRVHAGSKDEAGVLAEAFNALADELERVEGLRRDMVSDVAHELRAPLTNIRCELESVQDGVRPLDASRIDSIHAEILALGRLIDDLQDLAVADAHKLNLDLATIDLRESMKALAERMSASAAEKKVALDVDGDPVAVSADSRRLEQVARNLVNNAVAHSPAGGTVRLVVRHRGEFGRLEIHDEGTGVIPDDRENIFERFYRKDESRSRSTGGSGLGLAIAKAIIEEHGGRIGVEDSAYGGACFWFEVRRV